MNYFGDSKKNIPPHRTRAPIPPFHSLDRLWRSDISYPHLRVGQWFSNMYLGSTWGQDGDDIFNAANDVAWMKIQAMYNHYQWEM